MAGKNLAQEFYSVGGESRAVNGIGNIKLTSIAGRIGHRKIEEQISKWLVGSHIGFISGPECLLVELDLLLGSASENHSTKTAIAER